MFKLIILINFNYNSSKINSYYFIMKEALILIIGIVAFSLLILKKNNENFLEYFQNPVQVRLDNVEQLIFYTPHTLPDGVKDDLKNIIKNILTDLNNISPAKYFPGEYESVTLERGTNGDKRYIIDMFMYDIKERYNIRILIDIVDKNKKYHLNNIRMVNADEEIIPLISNIYGINTNNIVDSRTLTSCSQNGLEGKQNTSLDSSLLNKKDYRAGIETSHMEGNPGGIRNKWIVDEHLSKECNKKKPLYNSLCKWDKYGVLKDFKSKNYLNLPSYNPTITGLPHHETDMHSMFNLARGIVDFPHGSA